MAVRLLDADYDVVAMPVQVLGFLNRQIDGVILVVAMTDDPAVLVHHIPAILGFIVVDMDGVLRAGLGGSLGHISGL